MFHILYNTSEKNAISLEKAGKSTNIPNSTEVLAPSEKILSRMSLMKFFPNMFSVALLGAKKVI